MMKISAIGPRFTILLLGIAIFTPRPSAATTYTVTIAPGGQLVFSPSSQTINVGDTVMWQWGLGTHSTTSGSTLCLADDRWNSGLQSNPTTFSVTFTSAGTFSYFCLLHCPFGMTGEIVVQEPTSTPTPTATAPPTTTVTPSPPPVTSTPPRPGVVPTLSPSMLGLLAVALAGAALFLLKRS
jgi:plastocyanin